MIVNAFDSHHRMTSMVQTAFAPRPYPGDAVLVQTDVPSGEAPAVERFLRGRHWSDVSQDPDFPRLAGACAAWATPAAFCFYLPAFLERSLGGDPAGGSVAQALETALLPPDQWASARDLPEKYFPREALNDLFEQRVGLLTAAERAATIDVLEFLAKAYDAEGLGGESLHAAAAALRRRSAGSGRKEGGSHER
jgi:hypothetical protein